MVHTYREKGSVLEHIVGALLDLLLLVLMLGLFVLPVVRGIVGAVAKGGTWHAAAPNVAFGVFLALAGWKIYAERALECLEIRLSDDGTCVLETRSRVIRLHVNQISAVEYEEVGENAGEQYRVKYNGGSVVVRASIADFADFLTRLKTLNPAVDLTSFPADTWPGLGGRMPGRVAIFLRRAISLICLAVFGYVVVQALVG
jgi:hypothetical protein